MELVAGGEEHVGVGGHSVFLFFFVRGDEVVELFLGAFLAEDFDQAFLCVVFLVVEDEPAWGFGQASGDGEEHDGIDLHDYDGEAPGPLIGFAEVGGEEEIDQEGHVEAEDVGLEFLGEGSAASVIGGEFRGVDWHDGIDAT